MAELAFDNSIITGHSLYGKCGNTLDSVSKKDYKNEDFFDKGIECLDMDAYETQIRHGSKDHTMDAVMGIKDFSANRFCNPRLLLVELRMDYKSDKNLSKTALEKKVSHTKDILGSTIPINGTSLFIFRPGVIQRVRRWFKDKSQEGGIIRLCEPLSTEDFNELIKPESEFPYTPVTDVHVIEKELRLLLSRNDFTAFISQIEYRIKKAMSYRQRYNNAEYDCIMQPVRNVWHDFRTSTYLPYLSEDEKLDAEILEEDYNALLRPIADVGTA